MYVKLSETQPDVAKQLQLGVVPVTKVNCYQDVLTSIGRDIRNKHRRRLQRRNEMKTLHKTLQNLNEKLTYLDAQKQSYQDYINSCMAQLTSNRKKGNSSGGSKFVMPFTPQWHHLQELKKQGKVPQFGSFKYGADVLFKKGVLVSVDGYSPKQ
jgi:septal ring factor EnvC (AmiA/AmiB activator)